MKNNAVVKFTLPEEQERIFVSKYKLYLPTEEELRQEILKEKEIFETVHILEKKQVLIGGEKIRSDKNSDRTKTTSF